MAGLVDLVHPAQIWPDLDSGEGEDELRRGTRKPRQWRTAPEAAACGEQGGRARRTARSSVKGMAAAGGGGAGGTMAAGIGEESRWEKE